MGSLLLDRALVYCRRTLTAIQMSPSRVGAWEHNEASGNDALVIAYPLSVGLQMESNDHKVFYSKECTYFLGECSQGLVAVVCEHKGGNAE